MGRFPVIFLTLKSIAFNNFNDSYSELARVISSLALNFSYLKSSPELDNDELKIFYKLLDLDCTGIIKSVLYCSSMNMMFLLPKPHISVTTVK